MATVPVRIQWPVNLADAIVAEATGQLPPNIAALVEAAERRAYQQGRLETLTNIAAGHAELELLGDGWRDRARKTAHDWYRERVATFEQCARQMNARLGRPEGWNYRGGAVDWHTGLPLGSACAWLRRTRTTAQERRAA